MWSSWSTDVTVSFLLHLHIFYVSVLKTFYIRPWLHPLFYLYAMHTQPSANLFILLQSHCPRSSKWNCYTSLLIWPASLHLLVSVYSVLFIPTNYDDGAILNYTVCVILRKNKCINYVPQNSALCPLSQKICCLYLYKFHSTQRQMSSP